MFTGDGPSFSRTEKWIMSLAAFPRTWALFVTRPSITTKDSLLAARGEGGNYTPPTLFALVNCCAAIVLLYLMGESTMPGESQDVSYYTGTLLGLLALSFGYVILVAALAVLFRVRDAKGFRNVYGVVAYATSMLIPAVLLRQAVFSVIGGGSIRNLEQAVLTSDPTRLARIEASWFILASLLVGVAVWWVYLIARGLQTITSGRYSAFSAFSRAALGVAVVPALNIAGLVLLFGLWSANCFRALDAFSRLETEPPLMSNIAQYEMVDSLARFIAGHEHFTVGHRYGALQRAAVCTVAKWESADALAGAILRGKSGSTSGLTGELFSKLPYPEQYENLLASVRDGLRSSQFPGIEGAFAQGIGRDLVRLEELRPAVDSSSGGKPLPKINLSGALMLRNSPLALWPYAPTSLPRFVYSVGVVEKDQGREVKRSIWSTHDPLRRAPPGDEDAEPK